MNKKIVLLKSYVNDMRKLITKPFSFIAEMVSHSEEFKSFLHKRVNLTHFYFDEYFFPVTRLQHSKNIYQKVLEMFIVNNSDVIHYILDDIFHGSMLERFKAIPIFCIQKDVTYSQAMNYYYSNLQKDAIYYNNEFRERY